MRSWTVSKTVPDSMDKKTRGSAAAVALGGILAALAVVLMTLGGMIPVATYMIPVLCSILLNTVLKTCGKRMAWAWYGAVAVLGLLLGPDKEAVVVFLVIGHYPIWKDLIDKLPVKWLLKAMFFNLSILGMYWVLIRLLGLHELTSDFDGVGTVGLILMLLMGNFIFFMLDKLLGMGFGGRRK